MARSREIDMTNGPLLSKVIQFAIPLALSSMLQLLFNAADVIVVGKFAGSTALAAVGSTGALVNLLVNVFMGVSIGANVMVARARGAGDYKAVHETVHCAMLISVILGAIVAVLGFCVSGFALTLMGSPADVKPLATLYLKIYFLGMPANLVYNFGAAILRAIGDTKRPLYILTAAGVANVLLNLVLVIVFHMSVAGVAIATVFSQVISAVLVVLCLLHADGAYKLYPNDLRIHKDKLIGMIRIGLPAGIQGSLFSISNVIIQSTVNSFGSIVVAGNAAAANLEGFVYVCMNSLYQSAITFTSQNLGAGKFDRIRHTFRLCTLMVMVVGAILGIGLYLGGPWLLKIYASGTPEEIEQIIHFGMTRLSYVSFTYMLCGMMDVSCGALRGLGKGMVPMAVSLLGACAFRILWVYTVFAVQPTLPCLYISYPVSWTITWAAHTVCYLLIRRNMERKHQASLEAAQA
jgi:putative MATE family efflux protein